MFHCAPSQHALSNRSHVCTCLHHIFKMSANTLATSQETLRLLPPVATSTPRQVPYDVATVVLGSVYVALYVLIGGLLRH